MYELALIPAIFGLDWVRIFRQLYGLDWIWSGKWTHVQLWCKINRAE